MGELRSSNVYTWEIYLQLHDHRMLCLCIKTNGVPRLWSGRVWDLTSHITCLASRPGQVGTDVQEGFKLRFNSAELPVQVYLPPKTFYDALGFILQHLTPVAHGQAEMPHDKQDELHHMLLRCGIRAQGRLDVVMLNVSQCNVTTPSGEHCVWRNVYGEMCSNGFLEMKSLTTRQHGVLQSQRTASWKQLLNKVISQMCFVLCLQMQTNVTFKRYH